LLLNVLCAAGRRPEAPIEFPAGFVDDSGVFIDEKELFIMKTEKTTETLKLLIVSNVFYL